MCSNHVSGENHDDNGNNNILSEYYNYYRYILIYYVYAYTRFAVVLTLKLHNILYNNIL